MTYRILHVDDERDIRRLVELSLSWDPGLTVRCCASGKEAVEVAAEWSPHLILCDIMMPLMDGPATLACLRKNPRTARIPLIFMTARVQARELDRFKSLGASGVIAKPFSATSLRESVRSYLQVAEGESAPRHAQAAENELALSYNRAAEVAAERDAFRNRLQTDAITLAKLRAGHRSDPASNVILQELQTLAHKLAGAAGCFAFEEVGQTASALEESIVQKRSGGGTASVEADIDALVDCLEREQSRSGEQRHVAASDREPLRQDRPEGLDANVVAASSGAPTVGGIENVQTRTSQDKMAGRPKILIVDDDPDIGQFLSSRLRKMGVEPLFAADGVEGYRIAQREKPDVIISDYFMPVGNINFLLWKLRTTPATENIPVLVISGWQLDKLTEENLKKDICGRPGAAAVFSKPLDIQELFGTLRGVCHLTETLIQ